MRCVCLGSWWFISTLFLHDRFDNVAVRSSRFWLFSPRQIACDSVSEHLWRYCTFLSGEHFSVWLSMWHSCARYSFRSPAESRTMALMCVCGAGKMILPQRRLAVLFQDCISQILLMEQDYNSAVWKSCCPEAPASPLTLNLNTDYNVDVQWLYINSVHMQTSTEYIHRGRNTDSHSLSRIHMWCEVFDEINLDLVKSLHTQLFLMLLKEVSNQACIYLITKYRKNSTVL